MEFSTNSLCGFEGGLHMVWSSQWVYPLKYAHIAEYSLRPLQLALRKRGIFLKFFAKLHTFFAHVFLFIDKA